MEIYTVGQAAKLLSVSDIALRDWLRNGKLRGSKIGGGKLWRVTDEAIAEFVKSGEQSATN